MKLTSDGTLYQPFSRTPDPANPQIGDVRITFVVLKSPQTISLIAKQFKGSFEPWVSKVGGKSIDDLRNGTLSKDAMFTTLQSENTTRTWLIRLGGFALMAFGIFLVFNPLVVFADVLPSFGNIMGAGIGVFAIIIALPLTLITIAIGWVFVRPMVGIPLLVGAGAILAGGIYLAYRRGAVKKAAKAEHVERFAPLPASGGRKSAVKCCELRLRNPRQRDHDCVPRRPRHRDRLP